MTRPYRTTMTAEQRSERARVAAAARNAKLTPAERSAAARKAALASHSLDTYVKAVVDRAPELSAGQRARLAAIFAPASESRAV
jgi:uncharacterized protein YciW